MGFQERWPRATPPLPAPRSFLPNRPPQGWLCAKGQRGDPGTQVGRDDQEGEGTLESGAPSLSSLPWPRGLLTRELGGPEPRGLKIAPPPRLFLKAIRPGLNTKAASRWAHPAGQPGLRRGHRLWPPQGPGLETDQQGRQIWLECPTCWVAPGQPRPSLSPLAAEDRGRQSRRGVRTPEGAGRRGLPAPAPHSGLGDDSLRTPR